MELHELIEGHEYIVPYDALRDPRRAPRYVERRVRFHGLYLGAGARVEAAFFRGPRGARVTLGVREIDRIDPA